MKKCDETCEVYSRVVGYLRPVENWNAGKKEEFKDRVNYDADKALAYSGEEVKENGL